MNGKCKKYLDTPEAAAFLGLSPGTLMVWRSTKRYEIPYYKIGGLVRYEEQDLINWVESRKINGKKKP
jgi:excisionase family DNA binding protein